MLCPVSVRVVACLCALLTLFGVGCERGADRASERVVAPQPTPDRTVDAVVRGIVTLAPLADSTATPEAPSEGVIAEPASDTVEYVADASAEPESAVQESAPAELEAPLETEAESESPVSEAPTEPLAPTPAPEVESEPAAEPEAESTDPEVEQVIVKPVRGARKAKPTATPDEVMLQAASADESVQAAPPEDGDEIDSEEEAGEE